MRNLKAKLERLEAAIPNPREMRTIVISYVSARDGKPLPPGELLGFEDGDRYIARLAGESEAALRDRAAEDARRPDGLALLIADRAPCDC